MARTVVIKVLQPGRRAGELLRAAGIRLDEFGAHVEEGASGTDAIVIFERDRKRDAARHIVREQLDQSGSDWREHLSV